MAQFQAVTEASEEEARFFCEASGGDVNAAIAAFYEGSTGGVSAAAEAGAAGRAAAAPPPPPPPVPPFLNPGQGPRRGTGPPPAAPAAARGSQSGRASAPRGRGGFATLASLRGDGDDEEEEDRPNEYFAGGGDSGVNLVGGPRGGPRDREGGDRVNELFDRAREMGAEDGGELGPGAGVGARGGGGGAGRSTFSAFTGTGRRMDGSTPTVGEPRAPAGEAQVGAMDGGAGGEDSEVHHRVTFWSNGFTVDDGELRSIEDPAQQGFLTSIMRGEVPREFVPADARTKVHFHLIKKLHEAFEAPPPPKYTAFSGGASTLRSEASPEVAAAALSASANAQRGVKEVDMEKPITSVQIRLADGTRMVARFNLTHTVADIRAFLNQCRPGPPPTYVLMMLMPRTILTDETLTLEQAGLANAVVVQSIV